VKAHGSKFSFGFSPFRPVSNIRNYNFIILVTEKLQLESIILFDHLLVRVMLKLPRIGLTLRKEESLSLFM
jgi:hypothetical protein